MSMNNKIYYYLDEVERLERGEYVPPVTCEIDPSNKCNLDCDFCMFDKYRKESNEVLPWDIYTKLIKELAESGSKSITFTGGGEPLTNPHFNQMVGSALLLGFEVGLVTNGVLLNKVENLEAFKFIRVSLDAHNKKDYANLKRANYFDMVLENVTKALKRNKIIGLSYVVCDKNNKDLHKAEQLAEDLGVAYIQIKPAYINNKIFTDFEYPDGRPVIETKRHMPTNNLPCSIAALIALVGADSNVYYYCQHRGKKKFSLGSLKEHTFTELWKKRMAIKPNVSACPPCRYMNYAKAYTEILEKGDLFFQHRYFL
ncbi:MAG: radical SAM protein [Candidatus Heimdallarchaeaceae archaeon]